MNSSKWQANKKNNGIYTYTHTHIYIYTPMSKVKQSNKNKVQQIDPASKGNKKLYLPVKKQTKAQTKTKLKQGAKW